jgi:POT family proton-dependent oligopeptide transporter
MFFFWGEFAERSSFYGMRVILPIYLTTALHLADTEAAPIYSRFKMACYFLPLVGGFLADRFFGRYWTIVGFSIPYIAGHFILGIENERACYIALALLACGSGVIKPNISSLLGQTYDEQRPGNDRLRQAAFLWFYFAINFGALISQLAMPLLQEKYGFAVAFQFPAWLMAGSFLIFASGKRHYAVETISRTTTTPEERREQWRTLGKLFSIFGLMVFFWIAYEQNDSLWVYFTRDYVNLYIPFRDEPLPPAMIQFINALFVLLLIPFFNALFPRLDPDRKVFTPTKKMLIGFLATAMASGIMSLAGYLGTQSDAKISLAWPVTAYIVLTVGEVLLYGTGLDLAYSLAPKRMKGFVTACFLLTNTLGNFVNSYFSKLYGGSLIDPVIKRGPLSPGDFFGITTLLVVIAAVLFYFVARRFDTPDPHGDL